MLKTARVLVAFGLAGTSATHAHSGPNTIHYACPRNHDLTVERSGYAASVRFAGRTYDLRQVPSSIATQYVSPKAALIIDGSTAVFVTNAETDLGTCIKAPATASR